MPSFQPTSITARCIKISSFLQMN